MLNIHQITYQEGQNCEFSRYDNAGKLTVFFENEVIRTLHLGGHLQAGTLTGVVSHAFRNKSAAAQRMRPEQCLSYVEEGFQVIAFNPTIELKRFKHNPWLPPPSWHRIERSTLGEIGQLILDRAGIPYDVTKRPHPRNVIYSNHFFATPEVYARYCNEVLLPCMAIMDEDEEIRSLCYQDSKYRRQKDPRVMRYVREQTGLNYYTLHTFILERMPTVFLQSNPDIRVKQYGL